MRLLLLSSDFPYPAHGGALIRVWELLRFLGARHELTCVVITGAQPGPEHLQEVRRHCREALVFPLNHESGGPFPESISPWFSPYLEGEIRELAQRDYDLVIIERIYLAHWAPYFSCPRVLDEHNIESELFAHLATLQPNLLQRMRWKTAALQVKAHENRFWPDFALRTVVSELERAKLEERCPSGKTIVIPNGADASLPMLPLVPNRGRILFAGLLSYLPNIEAVQWLTREIMPLVWTQAPALELIIAGSQPGPEIAALADDPRVRVIANPESMESVALNCSAMVVPLRRGGGTRIKILQAFAWGLPVLSTAAGAEGLDVTDSVHLLVREDTVEFAAALIELFSSPAAWNKLRVQARSLCESTYDWTALWQRLDEKLLALRA